MLKPVVSVLIASISLAAAQAAPAPAGHEQMLRRLIQETVENRISYDAMTPDLAAAVKPQAALSHDQLTALGALKSVTFVHANADGQEIYRTEFANGALDWAFAVDAQGRVSNAAYRPAKPGS